MHCLTHNFYHRIVKTTFPLLPSRPAPQCERMFIRHVRHEAHLNQPDQIDPADEGFWSEIRSQYSPSKDFINLENGYFSIPAQPVADAFNRYTKLVHQDGTFFMRTRLPQMMDSAVKALATFSGTSEHELVITRNATEAMNILIQGYPFSAGDEVLASSHDYDSVLETLEMMHRRQRLTLVRVQLPPHACDDEEIVEHYRQMITPHTRVIVLTHMLHRTGRILPVAKIAHMARRHGVDVFVDAAHSFAHIEYRIPDLGCDFLAANLHKWLGAPLGVGLLYVRRERIQDIAPLFGDVTYADHDIRKLGHFGTTPPASILAIEDAIAFHHRIGGRNKEARLRYLKDYWTERAGELYGIELLTPREATRSCAIAAFRIKGMDAQELVDQLFKQHRIFSVAPIVDGKSAVRITPHLYNTIEDLDCLIAALQYYT